MNARQQKIAQMAKEVELASIAHGNAEVELAAAKQLAEQAWRTVCARLNQLVDYASKEDEVSK